METRNTPAQPVQLSHPDLLSGQPCAPVDEAPALEVVVGVELSVDAALAVGLCR
jgi:hypothetical protein